MHKKISEMPKEWPLARKGRKYIKVSSHNSSKSIPVVFALRDMLKIAETRREVKKICIEKNVKINGKTRADIAFPLQLRDVLCLEKINKSYLLIQKNKRLQLQEIEEKEANTKTVKIDGKTILCKGVVQANLQDGNNFIVNEKFSCGDSAIVDFKKNKVVRIISLKEGAKVEVIKGKHIGSKGKIIKEKEEGEKIAYEIKMEDGRAVLLNKNVLLVTE
jgi:small subunit ribosomal protein S4e